MRPGDLLLTIEHCHLCHLHNTTLRHKEEEYRIIANQFLSVLVECVHAAGVCARVGVVRFGTPFQSSGHLRLVQKIVSSVSKGRLLPATPEGVTGDSSSPTRTPGSVPYGSPSADARGPVGVLPQSKVWLTHLLLQPLPWRGRIWSTLPNPCPTLVTASAASWPQQRHSRSDLKRETEEHIKLNRTPNSRKPQKSTPSTPQKLGRLGAFEIQIAYKPLNSDQESESGESPVVSEQEKEMVTVYRQLLHSKLMSQRWPSKSVVARRCSAFLSRFNIPTYSSKGGRCHRKTRKRN